MKPCMEHLQSTACVIGTVLAMLVGNLQAQQVPIPQTAAEVTGPAPGPMTTAYVQMVGRLAYFWGGLSSMCITSGRSSRRLPKQVFSTGLFRLAR